jgi:tRNA-splicing ligase RtcB (3'-phosphate/5'-hydroxy nucleic acid ligase)
MAEKYDVKEESTNCYSFMKDGMRVPARIYASYDMIQPLLSFEKNDWSALRQLKNVSKIMGIQKYALAMADIHPGYGFPIGGVAAFDMEEGMILVGGVGFDINCGVRIMKTGLELKDIIPKKQELAEALFNHIPAGLGKPGKLRVELKEMDRLLSEGAAYIVGLGYGIKDDLEFIEENGKMEGAMPGAVSLKAKQRNLNQVGTLGSGNHYLEVQYVEEIYDDEAAAAYGITKNQIVVSIHCGSRGLGHQVGSDYLTIMSEAMRRYGIESDDKELVGAPIRSEEGINYLGAVRAASNAAFANRQMIAHLTREAFGSVMGIEQNSIKTLYEVAHNTAKTETHTIDGSKKEVLVHRKGSTRAFGPGRKEVPESYRDIGQPMPVGGTMGTASYILRGTEKAMTETFGSGIHGAGREKSRVQAKKDYNSESLISELNRKGIIIKGHSRQGISEEAPGAYKDIEKVVSAVHDSGINVKVARLRPIICIKG